MESDHDLPLVVVVDGIEANVEQNVLNGKARVFAAAAKHIDHVDRNVFDEAVVAELFHLVTLTETDLARFKKLRLIVRLGIGYDNIDGRCCQTGQTYAVAKRVAEGERFLEVAKVEEAAAASRRIRGQTLGIVGLGNIGSAVALRASAFGFDLCYYETGLAVGRDKALGVRRCGSLDQLLRQSDCVTLHCPMTAASRHLIDAKAIGRMKQGAFVVNTSRGGLIDETALAEALKTGKLAGAALDVHENEPYDATKSSLRDAPNLICTPHSAWFSPQSKNEQRTMAAEEALRAIEANPHESLAQVLRTCVNRQMLMQFGK